MKRYQPYDDIRTKRYLHKRDRREQRLTLDEQLGTIRQSEKFVKDEKSNV